MATSSRIMRSARCLRCAERGRRRILLTLGAALGWAAVSSLVATSATAAFALSLSRPQSHTSQGRSSTDEEGPLQVPVYPPGVQAHYLDYETYRSKRRAASRDPLVEARLARRVARDLFSAGDLDTAHDFLTSALADLPNSDEPLATAVARAELQHGLARIAEAQGRWHLRQRHLLSAEHSLRRILPADHPLVLVARSRAAAAEMEQGVADRKRDYVLASRRRLERIVRDSRKRLGPDNPIAMKAEIALAVASATLGRTGRAIDELDRIIARARTSEGSSGKTRKIVMAAAMVTKARILNWSGRKEEATAVAAAAAELGRSLTDRPVRTIDFTPEAYASGRVEGQARQRRSETSSATGDPTFTDGTLALNDLGLPVSTGVSARDFSSDLSGSWVEISLCVSADGSARDVRMIRYHGSKRWAENAVRVAGHYRYLPPKSLAQDDCLPQLLRLALASEQSARATGSHLQLHEQNTLIRSFDLLGMDPLRAGYLAATLRVPARGDGSDPNRE